MASPTNRVGKLETHARMDEQRNANETRSLPLTLYQTKLQMDGRP